MFCWITQVQFLESINVCNVHRTPTTRHAIHNDMACHAYKHDTRIHSTLCVHVCLIWHHESLKGWAFLCIHFVLVRGCGFGNIHTEPHFVSYPIGLHSSSAVLHICQASKLRLVSLHIVKTITWYLKSTMVQNNKVMRHLLVVAAWLW
jgi:hypothetical protein